MSVAQENESEQDNAITEEVRSILTKVGGNGAFLDSSEAFRLSIAAHRDGSLVAQFWIANGYYLYRDKIAFIKIDGNVTINSYLLPQGKVVKDEYFGDVEIFDTPVTISLPISTNELNGSEPATIGLVAQYQGCAKGGICYPPVEKTFLMSFSLQNLEAHQSKTSSSSKIRIKETPIFAYLATAFSAGLLLSFTPCVLPLIPILSSVIAGQGRHINRRRTGLLSVAYVLGTAVTYTAIGAFAGATGEQLQAYFQNTWAIGTVSFILGLMALSLFGLFRVQLPAVLQSRLSAQGYKLKGGTVAMVFGLGIISALVVGACVSPILISILSIAILKGSPILGGALMFSVAIGMGVILISVGFGAGYFLPKVGPWMTSIQKVFGLMLLAVAIYLLGAIPAVPVLLLWALLLVGSAGYFGWQSFSASTLIGRISSAVVAIIFAAWSLLAFMGGLNDKRNVLEPVVMAWQQKNLTSYLAPAQNNKIQFISVTTTDEMSQYLEETKNKGRPVLLKYYADWCIDCVRMENTTFRDPAVAGALQDFLLLQVDVTDPNLLAGRQLKELYNVFGPPAILLFDKKRITPPAYRLFGYQSSEDILQSIQGL